MGEEGSPRIEKMRCEGGVVSKKGKASGTGGGKPETLNEKVCLTVIRMSHQTHRSRSTGYVLSVSQPRKEERLRVAAE